MNSILDLLRRPATTAADLRRALAELPILVAAETLAAVETERRARLIDGSPDAAIVALDKRIAAARLDIDRLDAARAALTDRIAEAEAREALDALQAERDAAETEAASVADLFARRYDAMVDEMVAMVRRLDTADATVVAINRKLLSAGFDDRVAPAEPRFKPAIPLMWARRFAHAVRFERGENQ